MEKERLIRASRKLLENKGCEIIGELAGNVLCFYDPDKDIQGVCKCHMDTENGWVSRKDAEESLAEAIMQDVFEDVGRLRVDEIMIRDLGDSNALARYHIDVMANGDDDGIKAIWNAIKVTDEWRRLKNGGKVKDIDKFIAHMDEL